MYRVITPPIAEPVSLEQARLHLRVTALQDSAGDYFHPDDPLIQGLITAARQYCENETQRAIVEQTVETILDSAPNFWTPHSCQFSCYPGYGISLPLGGPLTVSSAGLIRSFQYFDGTTWQDVEYQINPYSDPGQLYAVNWPNGRMRIQYDVGYPVETDSTGGHFVDCPQALKQAILLLVGHWYENREDVVLEDRIQPYQMPMAVAALLQPYKIFTF